MKKQTNFTKELKKKIYLNSNIPGHAGGMASPEHVIIKKKRVKVIKKKTQTQTKNLR